MEGLIGGLLGLRVFPTGLARVVRRSLIQRRIALRCRAEVATDSGVRAIPLVPDNARIVLPAKAQTRSLLGRVLHRLLPFRRRRRAEQLGRFDNNQGGGG